MIPRLRSIYLELFHDPLQPNETPETESIPSHLYN